MRPDTARRTYRSAIVGTGGIATAHARAVAATGGHARLAAVVDLDLDRAKTFAEDWDVPTVYASLTDLLAREQVDLVHICTPPGSHGPLALECLEAGVTALVEKPTTLSLAELDTLLDAERRSTAQIATVFQHRFGAGAARLRALAASGELGRPLLATCATQWYRDEDYFAAPWRGTWESEGGGPTMGHGIHQFDLLFSVLGPWREVSGLAARQARHTDTEDVSMALVSFDNGAVATIVNSVVSPREVSALRFDFEHATVEVDHLYGYTDDDWTVTPAPGHELIGAGWAADLTTELSSHNGQLHAVLSALDRGGTVPVSLAETRLTMEFIAALYASAFTGERVQRGRIDSRSPFYDRMDGSGAPWKKVKNL